MIPPLVAALPRCAKLPVKESFLSRGAPSTNWNEKPENKRSSRILNPHACATRSARAPCSKRFKPARKPSSKSANAPESAPVPAAAGAAARWFEGCWASPSSTAMNAAGRSWRELPRKFAHAASMQSRKGETLITCPVILLMRQKRGKKVSRSKKEKRKKMQEASRKMDALAKKLGKWDAQKIIRKFRESNIKGAS